MWLLAPYRQKSLGDAAQKTGIAEAIPVFCFD